ncbi:glycosyltransferase [Rhodococcus sp. IEGM 1374]|uniref:glycosyltransferase n=1 Tax=Rhodococcus sp. IEGM 1374 TaxID=3082221 RepID=UPI002954411F|nr:glycosyltransferase [Rhodococcus sp. IEGM 1374]MDV7991214.1 glycosyltransferase [Rhodococcus sp. IEGM 1374]
MTSAPTLTVVTVVFNDAPGLTRTLDSATPVLDEVEYWIIDGSTTGDVRELVSQRADPRIRLLSEADEGLYDAMNKGLDRATGDYLLFMNAGDQFQPGFDPNAFLTGADKVGRILVGYSIERFDDRDAYLRPAIGSEPNGLHAPAHQATAYPRSAYTTNRYQQGLIGADWVFTHDCLQTHDAAFVDHLVCEFELGGRSSTYGDLAVVRDRLRKSFSAKQSIALLTKTVLWAVLPKRLFYRLLARGKYDYLPTGERTPVANSGRVIATRRHILAVGFGSGTP